VTAIVAMLFVLDDASPSLILHGWAAAHALGIDSAIAAQQLRCQAKRLISNARYQDRVRATRF